MRCDEGRTRYPSHAQAIKRIIEFNYSLWRKQSRGSAQNKKPAVRAYKCPYCGMWHITSQAKRPRRNPLPPGAIGEAE